MDRNAENNNLMVPLQDEEITNINLSKINVNQIKFEDSIKRKIEKIENIEDLIKGIEVS